jgi:putative Holliday junction resolvase
MRVVAFDVGERRTGVAVSDATGTLARPWQTLRGIDVTGALRLVEDLRQDEDGVEAIVVGLPRRLDGSPTHLTGRAQAFAKALEASGVQVVLQDERLTSVDAESRLAQHERDWRRRKARLDSASAAVILQEFLDGRARQRGRPDAADDIA